MLAAQAPDLHQALERAQEEGLPHVILDGKIMPADRCKEPAISVKGQVINVWYSGKAHCHGGSVQAAFAPDGFPLRVPDAEPGSVHDITAARALPALYHAAATGLPTLAGPGYHGTGTGILIPVKQPPGGQDLDINTRNALQRSMRCRANAALPCSASAGAPSSTSPPAPARSATSPAPPSSSPISSTATSHEFSEITSVHSGSPPALRNSLLSPCDIEELRRAGRWIT